MWRMMMITEAVNSVAIEHVEDCDCIVCKAADGDVKSLAEIMAAVERNRNG
jgi:hypothetical protein